VICERLWQQTNCQRVIQKLLARRRFEFDVGSPLDASPLKQESLVGRLMNEYSGTILLNRITERVIVVDRHMDFGYGSALSHAAEEFL
jgi:hypothetical protein